jgi:leucyl aminopeptidase
MCSCIYIIAEIAGSVNHAIGIYARGSSSVMDISGGNEIELIIKIWVLYEKSMNVNIKSIRGEDCACDALIFLFPEEGLKELKKAHEAIAALVRQVFSKEFSGRQNEVFLMRAPDSAKPQRLLLVGLGKKEQITAEKIRQAGGKAAVHLRNMGMKRAALSTDFLSELKISPVEFVEGALLGLYTYKRYKKDEDKKALVSLTVLAKSSRELTEGLQRAESLAAAVCFARDLVNTPANDMTPTDIARAASSLRSRQLSVTVLDRDDAKRLGMGAFLSVAKGSKEEPRFIVLDYRGAKGAPVVLIGKAITFDSGGISLKPSDGMEKMKYDMAGGAAVLGVIKAAATLHLPVHLVGILPATENLPGGTATKPGDVVKSLSGKTIEIINTDAEGRLVLADAIAYARRMKPRAIIDIATLTGACLIAFGNEVVAMMGNDRKLLDAFKKSGENTYERVWEMPLFEEYKEYLKSDIADIKNIGGRNGGLVTAAYFLSEFAGDTPWVHLDIAGTAWTEKEKPYIPKGASGIGTRLIYDIIAKLR